MAVIDLDARPAPDEPGPAVGVPLRRRTPAVRALVLLGLALAVGLAPGSAPGLRIGRRMPLPSYCTGAPIPGGRLNIVRDDTFIILDAITGTVVNSGPCPRGTGTRSNTGG